MTFRQLSVASRIVSVLTVLGLHEPSLAQSDGVELTNIRVAQRVGTKFVDVYYDLSGAAPATVRLAISANDGSDFGISANLVTGDVGLAVQPGVNRHIVWDAGTEWNEQFSSSMRVRITAFDPTVPPSGFSSIPEGTFAMGDAFSEGDADELPVHNVTISPFFIQQTEVTNNQVVEVFNWALLQGEIVGGSVVKVSPPISRELLYLDTAVIGWNSVSQRFELLTSKSNGYPCVGITWYGAAAYCNYLSEIEGFNPCYTISSAGNWVCDFTKDGYRLPTEAEWEYAARGGLGNRRFPWGDTISHAEANYQASPTGGFAYDVSETSGYHPDYNVGGNPKTAPVTDLAANGYGLFHMAGNVRELVNDFYRPDYYQSAPGLNPKGPGSASGGGTFGYRVARDGHWHFGAGRCRISVRDNYAPQGRDYFTGFRVVRAAPQP